MTWDTEFEDLMPNTCYRHPYSGQNQYGEPTFSSQVAVQCRVVHKPTLLRQSGGGEVSGAEQEVVSAATIYCAGSPGWGMRDKITLPDGTTPIILDVRRYPDEDGDHHETVLV